MVVPDGHDKDHARIHFITEGGEAAEFAELVFVASDFFRLGAEFVGDFVGGCDAFDIGVGLLYDFAVLDVDAADLGEGAGGGAVVGDELRDDRDHRVGVDGVGGIWTILPRR